MLYAVEINEPYQVQRENKWRCWMSVTVGAEIPHSWTSRPHRAFATENQEFAAALAEMLPETSDARVEPFDTEDGEPVVFGPDTEREVTKAFQTWAKHADRQARQIR